MGVGRISKKRKIAKVLEYLGRNRLMALGTSLRDKPWAATVFFAYDKKLRLLFFSRPDTRHCRNIAKNSHVSVVVNHAWKGKGGFIRGLQMTGRTSRVSGKEHERLYALYKARFKWADDFAQDHVLYIIEPKEVWYIDEKLFGNFFRVRVL